MLVVMHEKNTETTEQSMELQSIAVINSIELSISGADPAAGKGRGTNKLSCKWLDSSISCCIFETANDHLFVVSHY